jgi:hypothetical protein
MPEDSFHIPQTLCDRTEQDMKQAHAAPERLTRPMGVWRGAAPKPADFKDVQERAMDFATNYAESAFTFAGRVCNAKSPQEILTLQAQFFQDRMQSFVMNARELNGLIGDAAQRPASS